MLRFSNPGRPGARGYARRCSSSPLVTSGQGVLVGTFTTNGVGNGTFQVNTYVTPGVHTVAIDITRAGNGNDVVVTPGLYALNLFMFFK